jgi:hypothetical protein
VSIDWSKQDIDNMWEDEMRRDAREEGVATCDICGESDDHAHSPEELYEAEIVSDEEYDKLLCEEA